MELVRRMPLRCSAAGCRYGRWRLLTTIVAGWSRKSWSNVRLDRSEELGAVPSHTSLNRGALIKLGIPESAIDMFGSEVTNTYQEVTSLREWAVRHHVHNIIVPTEVFSSRRVRWILEHQLADAGVKVQVDALDPTDYRRDQWWHSEQGLLNFQNEIIK